MLVPLSTPNAMFTASLAVRGAVWLGMTQWLGCVAIGTPLASLPGAKADRVSSPGATRSGLIRASDAVTPRLQGGSEFWNFRFAIRAWGPPGEGGNREGGTDVACEKRKGLRPGGWTICRWDFTRSHSASARATSAICLRGTARQRDFEMVGRHTASVQTRQTAGTAWRCYLNEK
jgi:hypothetical protein